MTADALEKALCQGSLRAFATGLPSCCFLWGCSSGVWSGSSVSSSSCFRLDEQCQHLAPPCGASISNTIGMEAATTGPLPDTASHWAVANIPRMVASG